MSSQERGALPFMDSKVRCRIHLAAGDEEHRRQMEAAPTHSMLIPLTSGPGNGWSFAPLSRLRDAASKLPCLQRYLPVEGPQNGCSSHCGQQEGQNR